MVNAANRVFYDSNDRVNKVNRVKNRNREAVVAPDQGKCFCYAMCYAKYGDIRPEHLAWIDYKLTAKYGQDYAEGLVPNDIPEASQACDFSLSSVNSLPANTNIRAIWCKSTTVSGDTLIGHAYIITELQKSLFHCKMMFYDPEHNDEFGPYVVTPYGTSLPVTINSGDNSVVSIVYN